MADSSITGYTGATIHSEMVGAGTGISASAKFAGLTMDDVRNKLTISSDTGGGLDHLSIAHTR